jgi:hypothetical protein
MWSAPNPPPIGSTAGAAGIPASPPPLGSRDPIAWSQFFPGASTQNCIFNSIPNLLKLVKCVENRRKFRKIQTQFSWILCEEYYNFCYTHIVWFLIFLAWKIGMWKPRSTITQNSWVPCIQFLDMLYVMLWLDPVPKIAQSYDVNLFIWIVFHLCRICLDDFCS